MTVISCIITKYCTAHATDSLITELHDNGTYKPKESQRSKIIPVKEFRGAMAYWGLAEYGCYGWSTYNWLKKQAEIAHKFSSADEFASNLCENLNKKLNGMIFNNERDKGLGIHFTAYERVNNYWIPELFQITNWADIEYKNVRQEGFQYLRETFHIISRKTPSIEHGNSEVRLFVYKHLQQGNFLYYNNGDPEMFNSAASSIFGLIQVMNKRKILKQSEEPDFYLSLVRRPIEIVSKSQMDFCKEGTRVVGGKLHDLAITPQGQFVSKTGDVRN